MEVTQLRIVREVYNAGSVSRAAMRLNKSPSVLSRHISAFEKECGGRIFLRTGRGVELTERGEEVLPRVERIIKEMEDLTLPEEQLAGTQSGEVRLQVSSAVNKRFVSEVFGQVREAYPHIRLQLCDAYSADIDMAMENGEADVGVFLRNGLAIAHHEQEICQLDTCLVGLPGDPVLARGEIAFSELEGLPLMLPSEPSLARYAISDLASGRGISLTVVAEIDFCLWSNALLEAGAGYVIRPVGFGPAQGIDSIESKIREGKLSAARIVDPELKRTLVVSTKGVQKDRIEVVRSLCVSTLKGMLQHRNLHLASAR